MLRDACQPFREVEVDMFDGLLTDYAATRGASAIVRGIRNTVDFDYELQMAGMNRHLRRRSTRCSWRRRPNTRTSVRRSSGIL
jgi:phosphopantetheine adenylyltransferase